VEQLPDVRNYVDVVASTAAELATASSEGQRGEPEILEVEGYFMREASSQSGDA
jgi:hypothetical protein